MRKYNLKKHYLYILVMLLMSITAAALANCQNPTTPNDIPCMIISTWEYDDCNSTQVKIFNETGDNISLRNFTDFGVSNRCNFTWNITEKGSYIWNATNWDTGRIIVEADETMNLAITFGLSIFAISFIGLGIYLFFRREE